MKIRGIVIVEYDFEDGGFIAAAEEQQKLEAAIEKLAANNPRVKAHAIDLRERRGEAVKDLKKLKIVAS